MASESKVVEASPRKTAPPPPPPPEPNNKVAVNGCYGGFGISQKALERFNAMSDVKHITDLEIARNNPYLIKVIEELGPAANGNHAKLYIETISQDAVDADAWKISEYDGQEGVDINYEKIELYLYKAAQKKKKKKKKEIMEGLAHYIRKKLEEDGILSGEDEDDYDDDDEDYNEKPKWEDDLDRFAEIVSRKIL